MWHQHQNSNTDHHHQESWARKISQVQDSKTTHVIWSDGFFFSLFIVILFVSFQVKQYCTVCLYQNPVDQLFHQVHVHVLSPVSFVSPGPFFDREVILIGGGGRVQFFKQSFLSAKIAQKEYQNGTKTKNLSGGGLSNFYRRHLQSTKMVRKHQKQGQHPKAKNTDTGRRVQNLQHSSQQYQKVPGQPQLSKRLASLHHNNKPPTKQEKDSIKNTHSVTNNRQLNIRDISAQQKAPKTTVGTNHRSCFSACDNSVRKG